MALKSANLAYKEESAFPWIDTSDMPKWGILTKVHMSGRRVWEVIENDKPPDFDVTRYNTLLNSRGAATASAYRTMCRKRTARWERKNALALEILVKTTYHNARAQTVVVGNPEATAKELFELLKTRFSHSDVQAVINHKLGLFNVMEVSPDENGEGYVDRIERNSISLINLGCNITNETNKLERLIGGLAFDERFTSLVSTLEATPDLTWNKAVSLVCAFDERQGRRAGKTTSTVGKQSPSIIDPAQIEQLKRLLGVKKSKKRSRKERDALPASNKSNSASTGSNQQNNSLYCWVCKNKGHKAHQCRHRFLPNTSTNSGQQNSSQSNKGTKDICRRLVHFHGATDDTEWVDLPDSNAEPELEAVLDDDDIPPELVGDDSSDEEAEEEFEPRIRTTAVMRLAHAQGISEEQAYEELRRSTLPSWTICDEARPQQSLSVDDANDEASSRSCDNLIPLEHFLMDNSSASHVVLPLPPTEELRRIHAIDPTLDQKVALDSGATSHMLAESTASSLVNQLDLVGKPLNVQLGEVGSQMAAKGRANVGPLKDSVIVSDGVLVDNIASVPAYDLEGRWILCGGQKARIGVIDDLTGEFTIHAEGVLDSDKTYRFDAKDLMQLPEKLRLGRHEPEITLHFVHECMGHRDKRILHDGVVKGELVGVTPEQVKDRKGPRCGACARTKATRHSFTRARPQTLVRTNNTRIGNAGNNRIGPLEPLNPSVARSDTDIKGPFSVEGPNGERYFQGFTERDTSYKVVKLLKRKKHAIDAVKEYVNLDIARENRRLVQYHADGAGELVSSEITKFLADHGTTVTYSPPYTPELNGAAERTNRTIMESALAMLEGCLLPLMFWTYAVQYAAAVSNCIPTWTAKGWMTPLRAKYGIIPDTRIFKIFGCLAYVHIPKALRSGGLADKAYKGWFVGLKWPLLDRFLVYVPSIDKVLESAHVLFDMLYPIKRKEDDLLVVDPDARNLDDFYFLKHMVYVDPDDGNLYVTTRVENYRTFVCAFRAPIVNGRLGSEEPNPIHAKDTESMLLNYLQTNPPARWDVVTRSVSQICSVDKNLEALLNDMRPDQSQEETLPMSLSSSPGTVDLDVVTPSDERRTRGISATGTRSTGDSEVVVSSSSSFPSDDSAVAPANNRTGVHSPAPAIPSPPGISHFSGFASNSTVANGVASPTGVDFSPSPFTTVADGTTRRRRTQRSPLNVGSLGNIGDTLRMLRGPPATPEPLPLEKLAYLAGQEVLEADESNPHDPAWLPAKADELASIALEHDVWKVVSLPPDKSAVGSKWVNKNKTHPTPKKKSRLTVQGFRQRKGRDYNETFAPVAQMVTVRIFLALIQILHLFAMQLDVKTAFLHAPLEEEIYVAPVSDLPDVYDFAIARTRDKDKRDKLLLQKQGILEGGVFFLRKALYGLKQASRQWFKEVMKCFADIGFTPTVSDACFLVLNRSRMVFAFALIYVDDILLACSTYELMIEVAAKIRKQFKIGTEQKYIDMFLGIKVDGGRHTGHIKLTMVGYIEKMFKRFRLSPTLINQLILRLWKTCKCN